MKEGARFSDMDNGGKTSAAQKRKLNESSNGRKLALASSLIEQSFEKLKKPPPPPPPSTTTNISYGPLTQRLISALIEQNLMTPFDNEIADYLDRISPPESTSYVSPRTMAKKCFTFPSVGGAGATSSSSSGHIEKKIKRTLIEQGILELDEGSGNGTTSNDDNSGYNDEFGDVDKSDEIGNEILSVQKELRLVAQNVKQSLQHLVELSRVNISKQEIRKKIAALDNEVVFFVLGV